MSNINLMYLAIYTVSTLICLCALKLKYKTTEIDEVQIYFSLIPVLNTLFAAILIIVFTLMIPTKIIHKVLNKG